MINQWQVNSEQAYAELEFGPPVYKACVHCQSAIEIIPLLSGNPLGGTLWSDGFQETEQMPVQDLLGRCRHCNEIVSLVDLEPYPTPKVPSDNDDCSYVSLTLGDYEMLLQQLGDIAEEYHAYLRIKFWHQRNDQRRHSDTSMPLTAQEQQNLQQLLPLLDNVDAERLLKVEIYRQFGDFEQAKRVLSDPFDHRVSDVVQRLRQLVRDKNSRLEMIYSGEAARHSAAPCNATSTKPAFSGGGNDF
ncbi:hypothetical protein EKG38_09845 [Shewanella canadensis]|uniref:Uncharacterized protein n=1 Tax=Shewanella canadensis TaxID=271096 RepID=A0A3S0IT83_9GAMM|nr:hypothetical protein [Shewanella canadensis]RTR39210.1 hypothetical protein EKG38_09845 [Shewanella canadensis]